MNATNCSTTTPSPSLASFSSQDVEARIVNERQRLLAEQNLEAKLTEQRIAPLEAGDDPALDRIEQQINACRERQFRIQERIEILTKRVEEAQEREHLASLDRLRRRAEKARQRGEKLIAIEYAKHATALASVMAKLAAIEAVIDDVNRTFGRLDLPGAQGANGIRCRPSRRWNETVTKRVHVNDPRHPLHGQVSWSSNSPDWGAMQGTGERVSVWAEIEVVEERFDSPDWPEPLHTAVSLPGIGPSDPGCSIPPLWSERLAEQQDDAVVALIAELDYELDAEAAGAPKKPAARLNGGNQEVPK